MYPLPCPASETVPFFLPSLVRVGRTDSMRIIPYGESMMHVVRRCTWYCCTWYGILGVAARPHLVRATPAPHIGDAAADDTRPPWRQKGSTAMRWRQRKLEKKPCPLKADSRPGRPHVRGAGGRGDWRWQRRRGGLQDGGHR